MQVFTQMIVKSRSQDRYEKKTASCVFFLNICGIDFELCIAHEAQ